MSPLDSYLPLNPFVDLSVGEAELWGTRSWLDVPQIHSVQFSQLKLGVDLVRSNRRTQVRFIRGVGGSGKSHLFARLRRELGDSIFYAYVANPPIQAEVLESFLLGKIVGSLRHRVRNKDGSEAPYSQLRLLAYALLRPAVEQNVSIEDLHAAWIEIPANEQKQLLHEAMLLLETEHPMLPRAVMRCLLNVLRDDKENLASQWLAGTTYLTEADLKYLGEPDSMGSELHGTVIHLLGKLSSMAQRPFVLVLDQLDLITTLSQLDEFQRLLFALIDQSENWVVLIGLVGDRFKFWEENLNQALRGRVGVPGIEGSDNFKLPVIDVTPIVKADKDELIRARLASPTLARQRESEGRHSPVFPLSDDDLLKLIGGGAVYARHLLAAASERFARTVMAAGQNSRVALAEKVDALLEEAAESGRTDSAFLSAVELGERLRELVGLLAPQPLNVTDGPLRQGLPGFDGTDHFYECPQGKARLVVSDSTRRPFMALLERLQGDAGHTLLLRSGPASMGAQLTTELFNRFKACNFFLQVSASEAQMLVALGKVLAGLREKNYDQLLTDPPASEENVMQVLRDSGRLRALRVWTAIQSVFAGKPQPSLPLKVASVALAAQPAHAIVGATVSSTPPVPPPAAPAPAQAIRPTLQIQGIKPNVEKLPQHALETAGVLLKTERWMEVRRLHRRLVELGCECSLESVRLSLRVSPLADHAILHPLDPSDDGTGPQIVLWHDNPF